ncbi:glutamate racemase [uncultured Phyllobacterium sp.]|jgi:glutamate racemase|uniref:glutamate racemase n=2 Tax=Pseudomonadota TaxID=1224 RepID=UPI00258818C8|nr:glutamate racemase [uncultured Phyllobacterium sp.]|eukprot:gene10705-13110_t
MNDTADRPIIAFDSGIGGLTVLREARVLIPDRRFVYIADDAGFPYGDWDEEPLRARILGLFEGFIATYDPEIVIIPCNTASTLVLDDLRRAFPAVPFVGTVPAIKPAAERTSSGLITVLATPGTVKRAYTRDLIQSFATKCHVRLVGSQNLARMAEAHIRGDHLDDAAIEAEIAPCFVEMDGKRTDIVVLACTHYPFLANVFRRLAPWPVDWLDPAEAIARRALSLLKPNGAGSEPEHGDDIAVFTSGNPDFSTRRLMQGFGLAMA